MSEVEIGSRVSTTVLVEQLSVKYRPAYEFRGDRYSASVDIDFGVGISASVTLSIADARTLAEVLPGILAEHDAAVSASVDKAA
ncbi:hypothetical protein U3653_26225 [Nocardia sp. CDC186]|uniref:Uncharacterized protein n=1 Tax=Nocardia implantans TaxID=3108168 RepID=A0ABU6B1E4_9NOCA|nr:MULTISPECIES: hypothetical protein [unclassified Nocardia]MBF6195663.1 hypothetical protein [Nocardia beijingensis]MEA3531251.1 hypothetical protein [Nocardia sp. CDC192]MEB3513539.1 hypothetical protein [Nocardia sp. CDC186]